MRSPSLRTSSTKSTRKSMARASLPPGFRFHPTDVELIMYYLKRKVLGKKLEPEAIAEVNIYSFSPWDLPEKSCIKNKDLEWFFFCPRERKYSSGARVKRATENGYWKTTGKERPIVYNDRTVGLVKTLIFHLGHAPKGDRTDWVIHEYRIIDDQLVAAGVQDSYVLCKIFQKSGLGPKNGAQYGAPFDEAEWDHEDDDAIDSQCPSVLFASGGPSCAPLVLENEIASAKGLSDPKGAPELSLIEDGPTERQSSIPKPLYNNGSTSQIPLAEGTLSALEVYPSSTYNIDRTSVPASSNEEPLEMTDEELLFLLSAFTDDDTLLDGDNSCHKGGNGKTGNEALQCVDGQGIFSDLGDLDNCSIRNEGRFTMLDSQIDAYLLNNLLPEDNFGYIELNDLLVPLDNSAIMGTDMLCDNIGSYHNENMQQSVSPSSSCINHHQYDYCGSRLPVLTNGYNNQLPVLSDGCNMPLPMLPSGCNNQPPVLPYGTSNQLPVLPYGSNHQLPELPYGSNRDTSCLDEHQVVNGFYSSSNEAIYFDFAQGQLVNGENRGQPSDFTQRGRSDYI